jgi:hypothetical protein
MNKTKNLSKKPSLKTNIKWNKLKNQLRFIREVTLKGQTSDMQEILKEVL